MNLSIHLIRIIELKIGGNKLNNKKTTLEENNIIKFIIEILNVVKNYEKNFLQRKGYFFLLISRFLSILGVLLIVYLLGFLSFFIIHYFGAFYLNGQLSYRLDYWWSIPLLIGIPFLIKLLANFNNRNYIYCERIVNILEVLKYSTIKLGTFRIFLEILFFITFLLVYSTLQMLAIYNFLNPEAIENILNSNSTNAILIAISITIYLSVRILAMEEKTLSEKYSKAKRTFYLWLIALIVILFYLVNDLFGSTDGFSIFIPYMAITLLLAIEKTRDSFRQLEACLKSLQSNS